MQQPSRSLSLPNLRASPLRTGRSPVLIPAAVGLLGILALSGVYLGIVSLAESPRHALELFWEDRWLVVPILLTFGVQLGLFTFVRTGAHLPAPAAGASTAAGGGLSTVAMIACCVHHVTDLLPVVGIGLAATLLTAWKTPLMALGLATNLAGIAVMTWFIRRDRRGIPSAALPESSP
jgi:hypothetical protein